MPYQFHVTDPAELWKGGEQGEWGNGKLEIRNKKAEGGEQGEWGNYQL